LPCGDPGQLGDDLELDPVSPRRLAGQLRDEYRLSSATTARGVGQRGDPELVEQIQVNAAECLARPAGEWALRGPRRESSTEPGETGQAEGNCALAQRCAFNVVAGYIDGTGASREGGGIARSARRVGNAR